MRFPVSVLSSVALSGWSAIVPLSAIAQSLSGLPVCPSPAAGEYFVIVVGKTPTDYTKIREATPAGVTPTMCNYQNERVGSIGRFTVLDDATNFAKRLKTSLGLPVYILKATTTAITPPETAPASPSLRPFPTTAPSPAAGRIVYGDTALSPGTTPPEPARVSVPPLRPATPSVPTPPSVPSPVPARSPDVATTPRSPAALNPTYNPIPLGNGYAVLIDFMAKPEMAAQVQQALGKPVGLVSYGQRPYLLALYSPTQEVANSMMQRLSDRGFWPMVVDSRRVVLLRQEVVLTP